ncbi:hypothetical protein [Propionibacterium acidifaciens]|uniref:hypothetical protein n=1 Tax=Propionibacterium acidifaciens TaxID=556499 RepID=UPI0023F51BDB|nr:hypothetical protein [Propionibacterium acidifaciens]
MPEHMIVAHGAGRRRGTRTRASCRRLPRGAAAALDALALVVSILAGTFAPVTS